jgi:hypothetical protein
MRVVHLFGILQVANLYWLTSVNIALLPNKKGVEDISDLRPISIIHAIAKTIPKCFLFSLARS